MTVDTFMILYVFTFLMVGIFMLSPIIVIVAVVLYIRKKNNQRDKEILEQANIRQMEQERLKQEELNLKKMKYKRIRCDYCDSLNKMEEIVCVNCGATLRKG